MRDRNQCLWEVSRIGGSSTTFISVYAVEGAQGGHRRTENPTGGPMAALGLQSIARTDCHDTLARITDVAKFMKRNF
jgi:hypothetical protein